MSKILIKISENSFKNIKVKEIKQWVNSKNLCNVSSPKIVKFGLKFAKNLKLSIGSIKAGNFRKFSMIYFHLFLKA